MGSRPRRPRVDALESLAIVNEMALGDPRRTQALESRPVLHMLRCEEFVSLSLVMSDDDIATLRPMIRLLSPSEFVGKLVV